MSDRPYAFQGVKAIFLQPHDEDVPYEFYFKITSAAGANDGAIPFGRTLKGGNAGCNVTIRSHPKDVDYTTEIVGDMTNDTDTVSVLLSYPYVTDLSAGEALGVVIMRVTDATGILVGDKIGIELTDDTIHWSTVVSINVALTEVTIATGLPSIAAVNLDVYVPRMVRGLYHLNFDLVLDDDKNREFDFNRVLVKDR